VDLTRNRNSEFTRWVVSAGLLNEPFVLIDVGVQGGENKRRRPLGDCLVVHGFDPIEAAVQQLVEENRGRANRHYHCMALGKSDGEQAFYFNPPIRLRARCTSSRQGGLPWSSLAITNVGSHPAVGGL
jgi:hypothetical protein